MDEQRVVIFPSIITNINQIQDISKVIDLILKKILISYIYFSQMCLFSFSNSLVLLSQKKKKNSLVLCYLVFLV